MREDENRTEREEATIAEIEDAFRGVTREGGVSWSESIVIDDYGSESERAHARSEDHDTSWEELANDPTWRVDMGIGGFSFMDPIGYRYYLPAAMTVAARGGPSERLNFSLTLAQVKNLRQYKLDQWSLLNHPQCLAVRHFIEYMLDYDWEGDWREALDRYWKCVPDLAGDWQFHHQSPTWQAAHESIWWTVPDARTDSH